ncbi:hypothetical protein ERX37_07230 [Macrococcus hajekii]|uniref:ABC-2 type transporter transmembrane domain-containing protein n=1 Tax=Macrococcus hajekii TaxID=198482 RepID=A0A4R6BJU9_9STAP|nr:YhgE/Pip family protein [Macrococcus hajekii]TDM01992.1 hypothetical protein ERX37_07230 [Macrococcus hajekii]GGB09117.1 hypothetical protein GCM10007190_16500 [Macrococcus hajekii]
MLKDFQALAKHPFLLVALCVLLFLPIIYSAVFIYSMWDPYGQTEDLPIAIVNHDKGAKIQNKNENLGERVIKKLKDNDKFKWEFVDQDEATKGIEKGDYFAAIEFPEDFSENASTILEKNPKKLTINVQKNPGYSYSGQSIGDKSAQAVKDNISLAIREIYLKEIFSSATKMEDNTKELSANLKKMKQAEDQLAQGSGQVDNGLGQLQAALPSPQNAGVAKMAEGSKQVTSGLNGLSSSTEKMTAKIDESLQKSIDLSFEKKNAEMLSDPVSINENDVTKVDNYGQSFAPYVLSLSLYVGAIAFVTIYPVDKRAGHTDRAYKWWTSKMMLILLHGLLQGLFLAIFTIKVIGITIENPVHFVATIILWSLTAMMIVTFLTGAFSSIGKFLAIIVLILQLGSSEGTFPIQLTNKFFQTLHTYSPMTYVIKALRESIFGFNGNIPYSQAMMIIAVIGIVFATLLYLAYLIKLKMPNIRLNTRDLD